MHQLSEVDDSVSSVLVVGHNPGMHHASLTLAESKQTKLRTELELKFPTCALATLRFDITHWDDISPRQGRLLDFVTPEEL
jgi:phosphohistidine phosphatase